MKFTMGNTVQGIDSVDGYCFVTYVHPGRCKRFLQLTSAAVRGAIFKHVISMAYEFNFSACAVLY